MLSGLAGASALASALLVGGLLVSGLLVNTLLVSPGASLVSSTFSSDECHYIMN